MFYVVFMLLGGLVLTGIVFFKEKKEPSNPGRWERTLASNKFSFILFISALIAAASPGVWGAYTVASGQLPIGTLVLSIWAYPYWLLVSYLETRTLLKMRLGFSLGLTAIALAFALFAGSHAQNLTNPLS